MYLLFFGYIYAQFYYCPWVELGFDGINDIVEDVYEQDGNDFIRKNELVWKSRDIFCFDKPDEIACDDSRELCSWSEGICIPNTFAEPFCFELCQRALNGEGPSCYGECGSIESFYEVCDEPQATSSETVSMTPSPSETMSSSMSSSMSMTSSPSETQCTCTCESTEEPSQGPKQEPTSEPQPKPTEEPQPEPEQQPKPTEEPSQGPKQEPEPEPTEEPQPRYGQCIKTC